MVNSILEQYLIGDLIEWDATKRLVINKDFQRSNVWKNEARVYLIDTILRRMPVPKFYLRQSVNLETRQSVREVVDGQQRIKAILDFSQDKLVLTKRAGEFAGKRYSTLEPELQEVFLSYPISVEHLINASIDDVLEVFSRLNSYTVSLNRQELRHAKYQGEFKWAVREAVRRWPALWEKLGVVSRTNRVRMLDDELMAQMFGVLIDGVKSGGQPYIDSLYSKFDSDFSDKSRLDKLLDHSLEYIAYKLGGILEQSAIRNSPHFLMLFAAVAHQMRGIPKGDVGDAMPVRGKGALSDVGIAATNLQLLSAILEMDETEARHLNANLLSFWFESHRNTHRISSRKPRFLLYCAAMLPRELGGLPDGY